MKLYEDADIFVLSDVFSLFVVRKQGEAERL